MHEYVFNFKGSTGQTILYMYIISNNVGSLDKYIPLPRRYMFVHALYRVATIRANSWT